MKRKHLIGGLLLSAFMSLGAVVAFNSAKEDTKVEAATPSGTVYRFTNGAGWGEVWAHFWDDKGDLDGGWPGYKLNDYSFNESDQGVHLLAISSSPKYIIFHNNSGSQTGNITIGSNRAWYWDTSKTGNYGTWDVSNQTYYFYDYQNVYNGDIKVWAWMSNGQYNNVASYADSPSMTRLSNCSNVYSISLDPMFDQVKFHNSADSVYDDNIWINKNRGKTYCKWESNPGWSDDLDWVKAHDWIYQTMHIRDIPTSSQSDTGACKGSSGYYKKAKDAYNSFSAAIKTKISQDGCYSIAAERFVAWATANGESASFNSSTISVGASEQYAIVSDNKTVVVGMILVALVAVAGVGGYFFLKKKKEN